MGVFDKECLDVFLKKQSQLFDEKVASTPQEAEAFLEECMAVVCNNITEVREFFEESGMDVSGMSTQELEEASEVFALSGGRFLVVEG